MNAIEIILSKDVLSVDKASRSVLGPAHNAIVMHIGGVSDSPEQSEDVVRVVYDAHVVLAEKTLRTICAEAQGFWAKTQYYVAQYIGTQNAGEISIIIAVSSAYMEKSQEACRYVLEEIRNRAPIWKKEYYANGDSRWLLGQSLVAEAEESLICCGVCES